MSSRNDKDPVEDKNCPSDDNSSSKNKSDSIDDFSHDCSNKEKGCCRVEFFDRSSRDKTIMLDSQNSCKKNCDLNLDDEEDEASKDQSRLKRSIESNMAVPKSRTASFLQMNKDVRNCSKSKLHYYWTPLPELACAKVALRRKENPINTPKAVAQMSLTLDGRDKITKILQYSSRLIAWYYESLLRTKTLEPGMEGKMDHEFWHAMAQKFRNLQKGLTQGRKSYRLGRTFVELEKFFSMGYYALFRWYLVQVLHVVAKKFCRRTILNSINIENHDCINDYGTNFKKEKNDLLNKLPNHSDNENIHDQNFQNSRQSQEKDIKRPRIKLLRRVSSNIGWGPKNNMNAQPLNRNRSYFSRSMSRIGKISFNSTLSKLLEGENNDHDETQNDNIISKESPWKQCGRVLKLLGLAGFWAGDNIAYLYSIGFLPFLISKKINHPSESSKTQRAAAIFSTRAYFFAAVVGLCLNIKEWIEHRNGSLKVAFENMEEAKCFSRNEYDSDKRRKHDALRRHKEVGGLDRTERILILVQEKHWELSLALLKSWCDVMVFSNNNGIDIHMRMFGKKMNEIVHCLLGILSASTVLYNNYPAKAS
mmetsp:Transcript_18593/g.26167  ORF Transcript_18593/g.26167 Transcript_18593/m.26167 type:complete len:591 (+) Transcript_18593:192-1964(+)